MHRAYLPELFMFDFCCVLSVKASRVYSRKQLCDENSDNEVSCDQLSCIAVKKEDHQEETKSERDEKHI
jgi:hypothetical protein